MRVPQVQFTIPIARDLLQHDKTTRAFSEGLIHALHAIQCLIHPPTPNNIQRAGFNSSGGSVGCVKFRKGRCQCRQRSGTKSGVRQLPKRCLQHREAVFILPASDCIYTGTDWEALFCLPCITVPNCLWGTTHLAEVEVKGEGWTQRGNQKVTAQTKLAKLTISNKPDWSQIIHNNLWWSSSKWDED